MGILVAKIDDNRDGDIDRNGSFGFDMGHEEFDGDQILAALMAKKRSKKVKKNVKLRNRKHTKFKSRAVKHRVDLVASNEQEDSDGVEDDSQSIIFDEARRTCDLGKSIGLVTDDDNMVIETLAEGLKSNNADVCRSKESRRRGRKKYHKKE